MDRATGPSQSWSAVPPTSRHGAVARRIAATVAASVSSGVNHTAARPRSAASGAVSEPSDFPMRTGVVPVAAVSSSRAASACAFTRLRSWLTSEVSGRSQRTERVRPSRRRTAKRAYMSNGPSAL